MCVSSLGWPQLPRVANVNFVCERVLVFCVWTTAGGLVARFSGIFFLFVVLPARRFILFLPYLLQPMFTVDFLFRVFKCLGEFSSHEGNYCSVSRLQRTA